MFSRVRAPLAAALLLAPFSATAQETPTPEVTSVPPAASVVPAPITVDVPPPAAPKPSPRATSVPRATPTPRSVSTPRSTPTPRASTTPASRPTATPTPAATSTPAATPQVTPAAPDAAVPSPVAGPVVQPVATPAAVTPPYLPSRSAVPLWPFMAGAALFVLIVAGVVLRRRRAAPAEEEMEPFAPLVPPADTPHPAAAPPSEPTMQPEPATAPRMLDPVAPAPVATTPAERARLVVELSPLRAGLNLLTATAEVEVTVHNEGGGDAADVRVDAALFSARPGLDEELAGFFATRGDRLASLPFALATGESRTVRTLVTLPRASIHALQAAGRDMFVPVVALNVRYAAAPGSQGQTARAFAVGVVREGTDKLGPLWLDVPVKMHDEVSARPHGLALDS